MSLPDDPIALKALVLQLQAHNTALSATVRAFEQRIAKLRRQAFGRTSERVERKIEQLELFLDDLLITDAISAPMKRKAAGEQAPAVMDRALRKPAPDSPYSDYGDQLRRVGEDVSTVLDMIVAQLKV